MPPPPLNDLIIAHLCSLDCHYALLNLLFFFNYANEKDKDAKQLSDVHISIF